MNQYGIRALEHWRTHLPGQLAKIPDPEEFFTLLGETAEAEIDQAADALADLKPPSGEYLDEVARLSTARQMARSQVMRDMILIDPQDQEKIAQLLG